MLSVAQWSTSLRILGCGVVVSLSLSESVWAVGLLKGVKLNPQGNRLAVALEWETPPAGSDPAALSAASDPSSPSSFHGYQTERTSQGLTLAFPEGSITPELAAQFPQAFPELGIASIQLQQQKKGLALLLIGQNLQLQGSNAIEQPEDSNPIATQSFEVWSTSARPTSSGFAASSASPAPPPPSVVTAPNSAVLPAPGSPSSTSSPLAQIPVTQVPPSLPSAQFETLQLEGGGQIRISRPSRPTTILPTTQANTTGSKMILPLEGGGQVEIIRPSGMALSETGSLVLPLAGGGQFEITLDPQAPLPAATLPVPRPNLGPPPPPQAALPASAPIFIPTPPTPVVTDPVTKASPPVLPPSPLAARPESLNRPVTLNPTLEQHQPNQLPPPPTASSQASDLDLTQQLVSPQPFLGQLGPDVFANPLVLSSNAPFPAFPEIDPQQVALRPQDLPNLSALERPLYRLFGFDTADPLKKNEFVFSVGGSSFNNPTDFRVQLFDAPSQRGNDLRFTVDYGITDRLQFSLGAVGKDDTIFTNLIPRLQAGQDTALQFIYGGFPAQLKWQVYESPRLSAALVLGAEFASGTFKPTSTVQGLITSDSSRKVIFALGPRTGLANVSFFVAEDNSTFYSLALPITYRLSDKARVHLNPQMSFFPSDIPITNAGGNLNPLIAENIGFNIDRLNYYGTVTALGLGFDYDLSRYVKFSADLTSILSGVNSAEGGGDDSLFVSRPVYNVGFRIAPNARYGFNLYATNRFGPVSFGPSNLLAQPGGDSAIAFDMMYLPDWGQSYDIVRRVTYPRPQDFLIQPGGSPSTTLPLGSALYEMSYGSSAASSQVARFGLLDDLEFLVGYSSRDTQGNYNVLPNSGLLETRLSVIPDDGKRGLSAALGTGLILFGARDGALALSLYGDLPISYRIPDSRFRFSVTPKFVLPAQATGIDNILGLALGSTFDVSENTQVWGQLTPIFAGRNQVSPDRTVTSSGSLPTGFTDTVPLFGLGIRQLFPSDNSLYAADLFWTNAIGDYALQGVSALPAGESRFGIRFSILNGIPSAPPPVPSGPPPGPEPSPVPEAIPVPESTTGIPSP